MKFDFTYNTKTQRLNINSIEHSQAANLYVSADSMWRYMENDWNTPEEEARSIFRLEVAVTVSNGSVMRTYQYEYQLGQALYVFMMNLDKFATVGIYTGSIYLNPQRFGKLVIKDNVLFGDVYLNRVNYANLSKLSAIKELRQIANIGLKEAKDYCDAAEHRDVKIDELKAVPLGTYLSFSRKVL